MRGKQPGELESLEAGLADIGDGTGLIPDAVKADLEQKSAKELLDLAQLGDRLEDAVKIRSGWIYLMLKQKVGHKHFKKYLEEHHVRYFKAWECMCFARAAARHPALTGKLIGRSLRSVLALPEPEIHKIEEQITGIPAEEAAKLTRRWIEKEYREIQKEKARPRRGKPLSDEEIARIQADLARRKQDAAWENVFRLWTDAVGALGQLADAAEKIDMQERHFDEVFKRNMMAPLAAQFDRLVHKWRPIEEIQKRAEVIERPSFAAR